MKLFCLKFSDFHCLQDKIQAFYHRNTRSYRTSPAAALPTTPSALQPSYYSVQLLEYDVPLHNSAILTLLLFLFEIPLLSCCLVNQSSFKFQYKCYLLCEVLGRVRCSHLSHVACYIYQHFGFLSGCYLFPALESELGGSKDSVLISPNSPCLLNDEMTSGQCTVKLNTAGGTFSWYHNFGKQFQKHIIKGHKNTDIL